MWYKSKNNEIYFNSIWESSDKLINETLGIEESSSKPKCDIDDKHEIVYKKGPFGPHRGRWECKDCGGMWKGWRGKRD